MSRRERLGFVGVCLLAFAVIAALVTWGPSSNRGSGRAPVTVTLAPGVSRPAGVAVTDLRDGGQLRERFNADQGMPRLVLALAPT